MDRVYPKYLQFFSKTTVTIDLLYKRETLSIIYIECQKKNCFHSSKFVCFR